MVNNKLKLVKSATAFVIGAAVLTGSFAAAGSDTAFAKSSTSVKVSNGKLVYKSTGKVVKGYKTYNKALYKDGKKLTGLYKKTYYKAGKKATGTYKSVYYKAGKAFTGVTNKTYYKAGKKATGTYKNVYYKSGKAYTGVVNKTYYKAGKKATGLYKGVYYKTGKAATGIYKDQLYVSGNLNKGLTVYKDQLYKDAVLNKGLALFKDQLYKDAVLNKGLEKFEDKFYFDAAIADGTYLDANNVERAFEKGVEVGAKVKAVEAINAKEIKVTFNRSIDASTVIGASEALANISIAKVGTADETGLKAKLSEDKKTVTITSETTFNGEYTVKVTDAVKTTTGDKVETSTKIIKAEDKVAPTYVNYTKENASTFVFNFSEPINDKGSIVFKNADGTILSVPASDVTVKGSSIKVVLPSNVEANKNITVSFTGLTDFATNILETPFSVTIQKGAKDGVAPEITSVTPVNAKKFTIKFSEEVQGFTEADLTVAGSSVKSVTQDKADKTKYIVELNSAVSGLTSVSVSDKSYTDLSGEDGKAFSQIVNFVADTVKPTATAAISVNKDGNQVLTFTTSEDTTLAASGTITLPAKAVKNYVTTSGDITFAATDVKPVTDSSTQYTVELSKIKFASSALVKDTVYTVDLAANVFADVAGNKNEAKTSSFSFTRGADKDSAKPVLIDAKVEVKDNDTFTVDFGTAVELDNATVVNKANYYVAGATIDSVTLGANGVATVKLASGSNNYTGKRTVKITGVKAANGNVMDDFTTQKVFNENVKPAVQSAKVDTIEKGSKETTTTIPATAVASDSAAKVEGTYTGTTDEVATYTYSTTTSKWTADKTLEGLTVTEPTGTTDGQTFNVTAKAAKTTTTPATSGKTTIKVTLSEEVKAEATDYVVNVAGKKLDGVKATVTATPKSKEVTIVIDKELTADDFAKEVTLTSDDYKLTDEAGNKADISAAGIKVSL
ncbi:Ig-like domain-containing protein [Viridibacillus sp. FSL R5-0888]|uniref:Ig-like domain-containing protein n=1 Tax=Viridibacillus sp. FSL R5-0888 TaxID=2921663 RepID=UPI0030F62764